MSGGASPWPRRRWRDRQVTDGERELPRETPVAIVYDASTYAVMMATPLDLEDFALGLSLTEGVIASARDVRGIDIAPGELGVEVRLWLAPGRREALATRRRRLAGPTGCGLCGIDSLTEAARTPPRVSGELRLSPAELLAAMATLEPAQALGARTRAVHAAGFWRPDTGLVALREDVGRHNALDKLAGVLAREGHAGAARRGAADQPGLGGDGAEDRCDRRLGAGGGLRADDAGGGDGGGGWDHPGRRGAERRVRGLLPPGTHRMALIACG